LELTAIPKNLVPHVFDVPQKSKKYEKSRKIMEKKQNQQS